MTPIIRDNGRRYNARCKACKLTMSVFVTSTEHGQGTETLITDTGKRIPVQFGWFAGVECRGCGVRRCLKPVIGKFSNSIKCTAKCQSATGHDCECQCAGKNHGAAHC
jgi:hypothetical protein